MPNGSIVFSHSALAGRNDYDHNGYVQDSGTANSIMWGDKSCPGGITIDGVDLDPEVMLWGLI